jgi:hypothetical protein
VLFAVYFAVRLIAGAQQSRSNFLLALSGFSAGFAACNELPAAALLAGLFLILIWYRPMPTCLCFLPAALVPIAGLLLTNYLALGRFALAYSDFGGPMYEYPGSHWQDEAGKSGIDWAWKTESTAQYAFHLLLGHHGLFSLTPIFLLSIVGIAMALVSRPARESLSGHNAIAVFAGLCLAIAIVVIGFYLFVTPPRTHNYGGWTSGPRQLMWLTPLFLIAMLPAVDLLATTKIGRGVGYVLLGLSVLSVSYPAWNPWRHPWIYDFMNWQGWIQY